MGRKPIVDNRIFLGNNPLFTNLSGSDLKNLMEITRSKHFHKNSFVVRQGDFGDDMFIIAQGSVLVRVQLAEGEDITIGKLVVGDAFGEIALFDQQARTANIVTCESCELLVLTRHIFEKFLLNNPHIAIKMLTVMAKRVRATNDFLKDKMYSEISIRLGEIITNIAHAYGKNTSKGVKIDMKFEDQELGRLAGIPCDVVTAQLRQWEKRGILDKHFGYLTLFKPEELTKHL